MTMEAVPDVDRAALRLLPSETVIWAGRPEHGVARDGFWVVTPAIASAVGVIAVLFTVLLAVADLPGWQQSAIVVCYSIVLGVGSLLAPRYVLDPCEFVVTDRRVIWRRGRSTRSVERDAISFARIHWHRSVPGVGHLELVRAVPFGPLARSQRVMFHDVRAPDAVLALARDGVLSDRESDSSIPLAERLDLGENVLWGAGPEGSLLGVRDLATAALGVAIVVVAVVYAGAAGSVLLGLEAVGLAPGSLVWTLLFLALAATFFLLTVVGGVLVWWGIVRARAEGRDTEYLVTDRRVLIRRGRTELSLDRGRVFDIASRPGLFGVTHAFFILDGKEARALGDSGALTGLLPARDGVPPVFYELRDVDALRDLLLGRVSRPSFDDV
jgi:hypothetical protein